jgi:hypothetical protein
MTYQKAHSTSAVLDLQLLFVLARCMLEQQASTRTLASSEGKRLDRQGNWRVTHNK